MYLQRYKRSNSAVKLDPPQFSMVTKKPSLETVKTMLYIYYRHDKSSKINLIVAFSTNNTFALEYINLILAVIRWPRHTTFLTVGKMLSSKYFLHSCLCAQSLYIVNFKSQKYLFISGVNDNKHAANTY